MPVRKTAVKTVRKNAPVRVGIWGLGRAGYGMHCNEIDRYPGELEVFAACDIDQSRLEVLKKRYPKVRTYSKGKEFLADPDIDLIAVAVRSPQHVDYAIRALEAGKYVFIEKPVALTVKALNKLIKASEKFPGKLFCRHNRRFEAAFNHVLEIIHSGILGNVFEIKLCRHSFQFRDDWQTIVECGGGQLTNWGPHLVDHALRLLECPLESVWSDLKKVAAVGDAEDHLKIIFRGINRRIIDVEISGGVAIGAPAYTVYGDRGTLICPDEQDIQLKYLAPGFKVPKTGAHPESPAINGGFGGSVKPEWIRKTIMVEPANKRTVNDIYHDLYLAIRQGVPFPIKFEEACEVVRVTEQIKLQNPEFPLRNDTFGKSDIIA